MTADGQLRAGVRPDLRDQMATIEQVMPVALISRVSAVTRGHCALGSLCVVGGSQTAPRRVFVQVKPDGGSVCKAVVVADGTAGEVQLAQGMSPVDPVVITEEWFEAGR